MSKLKIKTLTYYIIIVFILGISLSSCVLYYAFDKLYSLNKRIIIITDAKNDFTDIKLNTKGLLITTNLYDKKLLWLNSIKKFDKQIKLLPEDVKKVVDNPWKTFKKEIEVIQNMLKKDIFKPYSLQDRSILTLKGEILFLKEKNKPFLEIVSLTQKIYYLLKSENIIFNYLNKIQDIEKNKINNQISKTIVYTIFFILFILVLMLGTIIILNKKILKVENKLIESGNKLSDNLLKIEESKLLLQNVIDSVPVSIFWKDLEGKYLGLNKTFLSYTKFTSVKDVIGKNDFDLPWKKEESINYRKEDEDVIINDKVKLEVEESLTQENGETINVITSKVPLKNSKNETLGLLGVFMDITKTRQIHEELLLKNKLLSQQTKMASMGEMLENIAHQWRQPLSLISSSITGLEVKKSNDILDDEFFDLTIKHIQESVNYLDETINDFREYFKTDKEVKKFKIDEQLEKALFLTNSRLENRSINIIKNITNIEVYGLKNEFIQIIMNLINNAIDVLDDKDMDSKVIIFNVTQSENHMQLSICDNGGGISDDTMTKIYDPYFTTKEEKKGTGIGLYMSKNMIEKHMNGTIQVCNEEFEYKNTKYKGAKFTIKLPLS